MKTTPKYNDEKLLISVNRGYEADLIKGSLENEKIPFYTKEHSGPAGFPRFDDKYESADIDFFVPEEMLEKAKMALPPIDSTKEIRQSVEEETAATEENSNSSDDKETENSSVEKTTNKDQETTGSDGEGKASKKRTLATVLFIILAIAVIFGIDAVMNIVRKAMGWE